MEGFLPTVDGHHYDGNSLVLETIDAQEETNLVSVDQHSPECTLVRKADMMTEEEQEKMALWNERR